jgi:hypothetical protein
MNNQVKLIDAEEAAEAVESLYQIIQRGDLTTSDLEEAERAYERFIKVCCMKSAVPTIKPGDKVRHKEREMKNGMVILVSQNGEYVDVSWTGISSVTYPITELEVMK